MSFLYRLIATVFFIGYIPFAPGTFGSLVALFLYYFIKDSPSAMGVAVVLSLLSGFLSAGRAEKFFKKKDPRNIVIDEFSGMLIAVLFLPPRPIYILSAFFLFRFFDVVKTWPIAGLERLKGSKGIMLDDIMAGIYANLILQAVNFTNRALHYL